MSDEKTPARAVSPGMVLSAEIETRGWSQKDLAEIMGRPAQAINEIVKGTKQITPDTAIELAKALGTSSEMWLNLESNYRLALAGKKKQDDHISKRSKLYTLAPIRELIRRGWIRSFRNIEEIETEVCTFLEIPSLDHSPSLVAASYRRAEARGPEEMAQIAWSKRVSQLARRQVLPSFSLANFRRAIPSILRLAEREEDVRQVPLQLMRLGVHFAVVPHLPRTFLDGATWSIGKNPVVALTLRYDRIDSFWFTLMHEIAHITKRHSGPFLDSLFNNDRTARDPRDLEADDVACNLLVDQKQLREFMGTARRPISASDIRGFARKINRHPGIIVGQLHHKKAIEYTHHRALLTKVRGFLEGMIDTPCIVEGPN